MNSISKALMVCALIMQALIHTLHAQDLNQGFYQIDREQLSGASVSCALKDSRGFMWFGTYEGLYRFDGTSVKMYKHIRDDHTSLCHSDINAIIEDPQQNLWIGTANGLVTYDREKDHFINVDSIRQNSNHLTNTFITALAADEMGRVWIGTIGGGLHIYDIKLHRFTYALSGNSKEHYVAPSYITSIVMQGNFVYVGTRGGLKIFDVKTREPLSIPMNDGLGTNEITCLVKGGGDRLLAGLTNGSVIGFQYRDNTFSSAVFADVKNITRSEPYIRALSMDSRGNLWIVTEKSGLICLDAQTKKVRQFMPEEGNSYSLPTVSLRSIYCDNHDRLWLGTYSAGVYFMDGQAKKFELYQRNSIKQETLTGNNIRTFAEDATGNVWIGGSGGMTRFNVKTQQLSKPRHINRELKNTLVKDVVIDSRGDLWIGTRDEGVIRTDAEGIRQRKFAVISGGIGDNKIVCLYEDKRKTIWAGTLGSGLFYFDRTLNRFVQLHEKEKSDYVPNQSYVTDIREVSDSTLWVGTLNGLHALRRETDHTFSYKSYFQDLQPGGLSSSRVMVIHEDPSRNLWFGTFDNGLNKFIREKGKFESYTELEGLPSNSIKGIISDQKGNLWISSTAGISRFNIADNSLKHYTKADGLSSNNFNSNSFLKSTAGKFLFGGDNGFNAFYPDSIHEDRVAPIMYLTDLKINNAPVKINGKDSPLKQHITLTDAITLSSEQRSFAIDFVALSYGVACKYQYSYMLEGFEENWHSPSGIHTATYTNIDPGEYEFLVKGTNSDGVWSETPARLAITIHAPLWKTAWAMVLYTLTVAFLIYLFLRVRTGQIRIKDQLKLEKLAREKEHELTASKMTFFTNISHELRTPLSLILMPLETVVLSPEIPFSLKKSLSTAYKNAANLSKLVNELMDFSKLDEVRPALTVQQGEVVRYITEIASNFNEIAERKDIRFKIASSVPEIVGWFDAEKVDKIIRNLLSNAFKFTSCKGEIKVDIRENIQDPICRRLEIEVVDNGIGIAPEELPFIFDKFFQAKANVAIAHTGTGIGLSLAQTLVDVHYGKISVVSTQDKGTSFLVTFPIDRKAYRDNEIAEAPIEVVEKPEEQFNYENIVIDHNLGKPELLIVEDNDELRSYLATEFSSEFSVTEAVDGHEAFNIACKMIPDVIISDIVLPLKTGIILCREVKADLRTSHIPVVLLTAKTSVEDQVTGLESGADVYILKPFSLIVLKTQVRQMIMARKKLYARYSQEACLLPASLTDNQLDREFLQKALDYIEQNLLNPQLSVEAIAGLFNVSRSQVYRKVKALTGQTVVEFIRTVRLKHALKLMEEKRYTLSEVAFQTGFNSLSYFTRSFKDQYGRAPSGYLALAKNQ